MKKYFTVILGASAFLLAACSPEKDANTLTFATSADYPPFEYYEDGVVKGFDIDLATMIAQKMGKKAVFENMTFSTILTSLQNGTVDAAISTLTATPERAQNFDFSSAYYTEIIAAVFKEGSPITSPKDLAGKRLACQLGSTMELWLKANVRNASITAMDNMNQVIEALKAGHADVALTDSVQARAFAKQNHGLTYTTIAKSGNGYGIALIKGSPLKDPINQAIKVLEATGEIKRLKTKWLENPQWKS